MLDFNLSREMKELTDIANDFITLTNCYFLHSAYVNFVPDETNFFLSNLARRSYFDEDLRKT